MRRETERGLSTAVIRGWQAARGEVLCVIDADLQHPPEVMLELYRVIERGADMAVASRHVEGGGVSDWSVARRVVSRTAQLIGLVMLPERGGPRQRSDERLLHDSPQPPSRACELQPSGVQDPDRGARARPISLDRRGALRLQSSGRTAAARRPPGFISTTCATCCACAFPAFPFNRFVRFAVVGLSGVVVDMGLAVPAERSRPCSAWGLTRSKLIAAEMAIVNNFLWNDTWTFGDLSAQQRGLKARLRRFGKFQLICLAGVALNTLLLNLQFNLLRHEPLCRERGRHRGRDGLEFLAESQAELADGDPTTELAAVAACACDGAAPVAAAHRAYST